MENRNDGYVASPRLRRDSKVKTVHLFAGCAVSMGEPKSMDNGADGYLGVCAKIAGLDWRVDGGRCVWSDQFTGHRHLGRHGRKNAQVFWRSRAIKNIQHHRRYFTGCVALSNGRWTADKIVSDNIPETAF